MRTVCCLPLLCIIHVYNRYKHRARCQPRRCVAHSWYYLLLRQKRGARESEVCTSMNRLRIGRMPRWLFTPRVCLGPVHCLPRYGSWPISLSADTSVVEYYCWLCVNSNQIMYLAEDLEYKRFLIAYYLLKNFIWDSKASCIWFIINRLYTKE